MEHTELATTGKEELNASAMSKPSDPLAYGSCLGVDINADLKLSESERHMLDDQAKTPAVKVTYFTLFKYSTWNDKILLFFGACAAIAAGAALPIMTIVLGNLVKTFQDFSLDSASAEVYSSKLQTYVL